MKKISKNFINALVKLITVVTTLVIIAATSSCSSSFYLSTMHHDPIYGPEEVALQVPSDVKIDTLSYSQLRWKLRTDSRFRWDFAQYAMDQPYSWYTSNYSFSHWRPYTSFDVYWNRYQFWNDWAFNYPFFDYGWGYNSWGWNTWGNHWNNWAWNRYRPYNHWNNWYTGPWSNPGYNVIWNSSRENTMISYSRGRRGSRFIDNGNSNIENTISTRYNRPRNNVNNNNNVINNIVDRLRDRFNDVRVYNNPNNVPNNNVIRYNNGRPVVPNNNNNSRPVHNWNNNTINPRPSIPNINNSSNSFSRGGSGNISSGGSSRGSNGGVSSGGSSGGSSRGGGKIN